MSSANGIFNAMLQEFENAARLLGLDPGIWKVLTHPMILRTVWGAEYSQDTGVLRTAVNQLRNKLHDDPAHPSFILTEPRIGYRFLTPD